MGRIAHWIAAVWLVPCEAPRAWEVGYISSYASAFPFNIQTGTDRNGDSTVNDRPAGVGRNTGVGFSAAALNVRLSRAFRLGERWRVQALVEGFNVLNRVNRQLPNNVAGPALGRATAAGDPRQVQIGLRVSWASARGL